MSDTALSGMYVTLGLNTAEFEAGGQRAQKLAQETAGEIDQSFTSITESRHGLMLTEEALGVHVPRSLNTLLAKIPAVSAAFSAILPIAGVVVALEIIGKLIAKHDALAASIQKAAIESTNLAAKEADQTKSMGLANLKLDDQIAKLENRPTTNRIKEALLEAGIAADKLAASFATDFGKIDENLLNSQGFISNLKLQLAEIAAHPFNLSPTKGADALQAALLLVTSQMMNVQAAQRQVSEATADGVTSDAKLIAGLQQEQLEYKALATSAAAAVKVVDAKTHPEEAAKLSQAWTMAEAAVTNVGIQILETQKRMHIATLDDVDDVDERKSKWETYLDDMEKKFISATSEQRKVTKEAAKEKEKLDDDEREATAAVNAASAKFTDDVLKRNRDLYASYEALVGEKIKLAASDKAEGVKAKASLNLISAQEEQKQLHDIYDKELADLKVHNAEVFAADADFVAQAKAAAAAAPTGSEAQSKALDDADKAQKKLNEDTKAGATAVAAVKKELDGADSALNKLQSSWASYFAKMNNETKDLGAAIRKNLQGSIDSAVNSISSSFAKMVVESKSMGKAMKALAVEIAESFISMLVKEALQYVIHKLVMTAADKVAGLGQIGTAAAVAGAGGVASMAAAPFPIDMTAPAFGAGMFADAMSYAALLPASQGALIDAPAGVGVPIMAHGKELVLPAHISSGLQEMIGRGGGGRTTNVTMNVASPDSDGFKASSGQITSKLHREIARTSARDN